jgi:hypothetical protein
MLVAAVSVMCGTASGFNWSLESCRRRGYSRELQMVSPEPGRDDPVATAAEDT